MSPLDWANHDLYWAARDRDRRAWLTDALRRRRDALMRGEDGRRETGEYVRRVDAIRGAVERWDTQHKSDEPNKEHGT